LGIGVLEKKTYLRIRKYEKLGNNAVNFNYDPDFLVSLASDRKRHLQAYIFQTQVVQT